MGLYDENLDHGELRKHLRDYLIGEGVTELECDYSGSGDSGGINGVNVTGGPEGLLERATVLMVEGLELNETVAELFENICWELLRDTHPGFEIDDGSDGTFVWKLATDEIENNHNEHYTATNSSTHTF